MGAKFRKYIVVCQQDVIFCSNKIMDCYAFITDIYKKFPEHMKLNIYELRK